MQMLFTIHNKLLNEEACVLGTPTPAAVIAESCYSSDLIKGLGSTQQGPGMQVPLAKKEGADTTTCMVGESAAYPKHYTC